MKAMILSGPGQSLQLVDRQLLVPEKGRLRIRVNVCGVCRTDLHVQDGDLPQANYPIVPGHEIVGIVDAVGDAVEEFRVGDRIGVPWLGSTCGNCFHCLNGMENLCDTPTFTGCSRDGGFSEYVIADAKYCLHLPKNYTDAEAAPLLCAGLIGYRALKMTGSGTRIGIYGFGAAAHLIAQVAIAQGKSIYAFTRPGDQQAQAFAHELGCRWAGDSSSTAPEPLDAALIFAPVGELIPVALRAIKKGGTVVCAGIHMSAIPSFPYSLLWGERCVRSVANLTRQDGVEFMELATKIQLKIHTASYPLAHANQALSDLRQGLVTGAAILAMGPSIGQR